MKNQKRVSKILVFVFIVVSLFSSLATQFSVSAEGENLLRGDPSFESYDLGPRPQGIDIFDVIAGVDIEEPDKSTSFLEIVEGGANGTGKALQYNTGGWDGLMQHRSGPLEANTTYKYSAMIKGNVFLARIIYPAKDGEVEVELHNNGTGVGPEWVKIEHTFTTDEATILDKTGNNCGFYMHFQSCKGIMYVDEISLVKVADEEPEPTEDPTVPTQEPVPTEVPVQNLLRGDTTFESYELGIGSSSNVFDYMQVEGDEKFEIVADGANGTAKAFKLKSAAYQSAFQHNANSELKPNTPYKLSAYVKGPSLKFRIEIPDTGGAKNEIVVAEFETGPEEWTYVEKVFVTGEDTRIGDHYFILGYGTLGIAGDVYIDEIILTETSLPEPTIAPTVEPTPAATVEPTPVPTEEPVKKPKKPKIKKIQDNKKKITGTVEAGAKVEIKIKKKTHKAKVNGKKFTLTLKKPLKAGTVVKAFAIKDSVKSKAAKTVVVPRKPTVKKLKAGARIVKGKGSPSGRVFVTVGKKTYKGKVNKKGNYSVRVNKLKKKTKVKVRVKVGKQFSAFNTVKVK